MKYLSKKITLPLITLTLLTLGGCGEKGREVKDRVDETVDLQGNYQSQGSKELSIRAGGVGCIVHKLDITVTKMTIRQIAYDDADCKGKPLGELITEGSIKVGTALDFEPGAHALDYTISKVSIKALDESWLKVLGIDASGDCKIDELPVGKTKEITGKKCGALGEIPDKGEVYYTSYVVKKNELRFTTLPNEASDHVGTKSEPAKRNEDLKVTYKRV